MRVAVAKYPIGRLRDFEDFAGKQAHLLGEARARGARLAVLPEYLSLELAGSFPSGVHRDLQASLAALQPLYGDWCTLFARLAAELEMQLIAGTFLLDAGSGRYRNRALWFTPEGRIGWQDKLQLTGFEKQAGVIEAGDALKVFEGDGIRAAVSICYDSEFPLPVRAQVEAGARLLLVPSCTDTAAGATRVRVGCLARALENRCFVAQAVTTGEAEWSPALDVNTGEAAILAPMDHGFTDDGVLAQTQGEETWAIADLDFTMLEASRADAQVANDRDWPGQLVPAIVRARIESLQDHR